VELSTPLVCHPDSMLVYPILSAELQDEWDTIEGLRQQEIITPKVNFVGFDVFSSLKKSEMRDAVHSLK
jgi:hypothetical protein